MSLKYESGWWAKFAQNNFFPRVLAATSRKRWAGATLAGCTRPALHAWCCKLRNRQKLGRTQLSGGALLPRSIATTLTDLQLQGRCCSAARGQGAVFDSCVWPRSPTNLKGAKRWPPDPSDRAKPATNPSDRWRGRSRAQDEMRSSWLSLTRAAQNGSRPNLAPTTSHSPPLTPRPGGEWRMAMADSFPPSFSLL